MQTLLCIDTITFVLSSLLEGGKGERERGRKKEEEDKELVVLLRSQQRPHANICCVSFAVSRTNKAGINNCSTAM